MTVDNAKVRRRLSREIVAWMTTVSPTGQPQTSPVWFLLDGDDIVMYSLESPRVRNVEQHPEVSLNLDGDHYGGNVLSIEGEATIDRTIPPADENGAYLNKYRTYIAANRWTPEEFAAGYPVPIRIRINRMRSW